MMKSKPSAFVLVALRTWSKADADHKPTFREIAEATRRAMIVSESDRPTKRIQTIKN